MPGSVPRPKKNLPTPADIGPGSRTFPQRSPSARPQRGRGRLRRRADVVGGLLKWLKTRRVRYGRRLRLTGTSQKLARTSAPNAV